MRPVDRPFFLGVFVGVLRCLRGLRFKVMRPVDRSGCRRGFGGFRVLMPMRPGLFGL